MESSISLGVGVGLIAGVHEWPLQRGFEADNLFKELGSSADLKCRSVAPGLICFRPDLSGAGNDLPRDEMWEHAADEIIKRNSAIDQIVFVRAVGVPFAIGVVLVDPNVERRRKRFIDRNGGAPEHFFTRLVVENGLTGRANFGRGIFGVSMIDVEPRPIGQDSVGQLRFDGRRQGFEARSAPGVVTGCFVLVVPVEPRTTLLGVGIDYEGRRGNRVILGATRNAELGFNPADFVNGHN